MPLALTQEGNPACPERRRRAASRPDEGEGSASAFVAQTLLSVLAASGRAEASPAACTASGAASLKKTADSDA